TQHELSWRHRFLIAHEHQGIQGAWPLEWNTAGEHLIQNNAEAIDVGGWPNAFQLAGCLLRRHVGRRAYHISLTRLTGIRGQPLGHAEVSDFGNAEAVGSSIETIVENVGGLEVSVNETLYVSEMNGAGHGFEQFRRLPRRLGFALQFQRDRSIFDQF